MPALLTPRTTATTLDALTRRERTILRLVAEGREDAEIAAAIEQTPIYTRQLVMALYARLGLSEGNKRVLAARWYWERAQATTPSERAA